MENIEIKYDTEVKYISIKEFRELGFLQEVNRCFFHPLGLALETQISETDEETLGDIWDYRNDPEGIEFVPSTISKEKIKRVQELLNSKKDIRTKKFGSHIQG
jgi:hypothetical protein